MPYKYVYAPTKGTITSVPPTMLDKEANPFSTGMYIGHGEMVSDYGYKQFPTRGLLKTNKLDGIVLKIEEFKMLDITTQLLCLTSRHIYCYSTTTKVWDCITRSLVIDDCEAAWDAQANVISTRDTAVKLRGVYASKHVIAAGFGTGLASSEDDVTTVNISDATYNYLCFWAYSSIATEAGDLQLRLSEQVAGGVGATYATYDFPALVAGEWKHCNIDITSPSADSGGIYPNDLNALASVALVVATDSGAQIVYLDDIRTCDCFTGNADNRFSTTIYNDSYILTNGLDPIMKYDGVLATGLELLPTALAAGTITRASIVFTLRDHVHFCNNTENGSVISLRDSWSDLGDGETYTGGTSGYQDLNDESSEIIAAQTLTQDVVLIYKKDSIIQCQWVGGTTPFKYTTLKYGIGAQGIDCVSEMGGFHVILGESFIYTYGGGETYEVLDKGIMSLIYGSMNKTYIKRSFFIYDKRKNVCQVWFSVTDENPDRGMVLNLLYRGWFKRVKSITGWGKFKLESAITIGDLANLTIGELGWLIGDARTKANEPTILFGNADGEVFQIDEISNNEDGVAIESRFETPDFELSEDEIIKYGTSEFSISELGIEAKGNLITMEWSVDAGVSWHPTQGGGTNEIVLADTYAWHNQYFDATGTKIRFRFSNITISSGFRFRAYRWHVIIRKQ